MITDQEKFVTEFKALDYLKTYYTRPDFELIYKYVEKKDVASETMRIVLFMEMACKTAIKSVFKKNKPKLLELGGGPTLYQLMNIVSDVDEIHFSDLVDDNLEQIRKWKKDTVDSYDWKQFLEASLMISQDTLSIKEFEINKLEKELKEKITVIQNCDIFQDDLGIKTFNYDIINTHFVADCATNSRTLWEKSIKNIYNKLAPGGLLLMSTLRGAKGSYKVLDKDFPAVEIYEKDLENILGSVGFDIIRLFPAHSEDRSNNYEGFIFVIAQKT